MKSKKTLITIAVASTFGWSAAVFAGPSHTAHEVITPASPNEAGEMMNWTSSGFRSNHQASAVGGTSLDEAGGALSGAYSDSSGISGSEDFATLSADESLALADQGIYSDFHVVTFEPATIQGWDYYVLDTAGSDQLALHGETYLLMPTHELAIVPSTSDEMIYELVLVQTSSNDVIARFGSGLTESFGE